VFEIQRKFINPFALVSLIDDDFGIAFDIFLFVSNIKREVYSVLDSFFSF
jgi:hypothetical protein